MQRSFTRVDEKIRSKLKCYSDYDREFWSFRKENTRDQINSLFQYPAMMVPKMQEELIGTILEAAPGCRSLYEPFVGAGTVMLSAMKHGMNFAGYDINPLAILVCLTKRGPFFDQALKEKSKHLVSVIKADGKCEIETRFPKLRKWFKDDVAVELSRIRRAITGEPQLWCRRFYWVALAETVRLTSNSRTTTFKLHIKPHSEVESATTSPISIFAEILEKNIGLFASHRKLLAERRMLKNGFYRGEVVLKIADSTTIAPHPSCLPTGRYDLLVTSPPYGDNKTTIPYGQHSFLPLQWIDLVDISPDIDDQCISTTHEIDSQSLGGSLRGAIQDRHALEASPTLTRTLRLLQKKSKKCHQRVAAFWRDLSHNVASSSKLLKENGYMIWTVGNRTVAGHTIRMDQILEELLLANDAVLIERIKRPIPTKRMARKNNFSPTMCDETVLILRKARGSR